MARICPETPPRSALTPGDHAELELLDTLERGLPSAYTLFHSVDWTRASAEKEQHGEIDIVVVNQGGDVLLMEVKSGGVEFRPSGIFKIYGNRPKDVTAQVGLQYGALRSRLQEEGLSVQLRHLLVLPDVLVQSSTVQWPRERIVDSAEVASICSRVVRVLGPGSGDARTLERTIAFFENRFRVQPDVSALAGRLQQTSTRLSAGLATWVPRIDAPSGVIRVAGTAGSGKTQLALRLLRDADATGRRAAYFCFNRALADHMARVAPVRTPAETFHEFALRVSRRSGLEVDFASAGAFERVTDRCIEVAGTSEPDLDLVVVDEVQDLQPEWVQTMLSRLRTDGRAVLLEDPGQRLYSDRVSFDVAGAVTVTSHENFRSPRALVRLINGLRLADVEVDALSAHEGELPDPIVYDSAASVQPCTVQAIERCVQRGFPIHDIAVVSLKGRDRSFVQGSERLGRWSVRRFTGRFDDGGAAIWSTGDLLVESVRRFKGQSAAAIVLTECEAEDLDDMTRRLLFVGLTRARMHLEWVMSPSLASIIRKSLSA